MASEGLMGLPSALLHQLVFLSPLLVTLPAVGF